MFVVICLPIPIGALDALAWDHVTECTYVPKSTTFSLDWSQLAASHLIQSKKPDIWVVLGPTLHTSMHAT